MSAILEKEGSIVKISFHEPEELRNKVTAVNRWFTSEICSYFLGYNYRIHLILGSAR
jgi:hypothetical protein